MRLPISVAGGIAAVLLATCLASEGNAQHRGGGGGGSRGSGYHGGYHGAAYHGATYHGAAYHGGGYHGGYYHGDYHGRGYGYGGFAVGYGVGRYYGGYPYYYGGNYGGYPYYSNDYYPTYAYSYPTDIYDSPYVNFDNLATTSFYPPAVNPYPATTPPQRVGVTVRKDSVDPPRIEVTRGSTVYWDNISGSPQTITSDVGLWESGTIPTAYRYITTFNQPGTYPYHSTTNPNMRGVVVVR
jgi:plastocyanin